MTYPNFFLLGGPKCGTTSMASWLAEHPRVYMSHLKEPHYFSTDYNAPFVADETAYRDLFRDVPENALAVGEASTTYVYSQEAVANIERTVPGARMIVMLRNPMEMAPSFHNQMVLEGAEDRHNFEEAWQLQDRRARGEDIPRNCWGSARLQYKNVCLLGQHLERVYRTVGRERVLVLFLEDLKAAPHEVWIQVQEFLALPDDGRTAFPSKNAATRPKSWLINTFLRNTGRIAREKGLPLPGFGILSAVDRMNRRKRERPPFSPAMKRELQTAFGEDIRRLSEITGRNLDHWLAQFCELKQTTTLPAKPSCPSD